MARKLEQMGARAIIEDLPKYLKGMGKMRKETEKTQGAIGKIKGVAKGAIGGLLKLGVLAGGAAAAGIAAIGAISIKTAISVESAFAGVAKTTDGLIDEFGKMTEAGEEVFQGFRNLAKEVPVAVEELMAIGELAGQLGVPREALIDFTEVVAELAETTVLSTEEAATSLARLAAVFEVESEDLTESTRNVGSALVELGNNFETNERDIIAFAERLAGAGKLAGLTQQDLLAIGAAMASVGIEAESGGTAIQKVLIAMTEAVVTGGDELKVFADTVGLTTSQFRKDFETDAAGVFEKFVEQLGTQGQEAILTLDELGLSDQRLVRAFLSLAGAGDKLESAFITSNRAFDEGNALAKEARLRFQTTESQLKIFKNTLRDVAITIGSALLPFLNKMLDFLKPFIEELGRRIPDFLDKLLLALERFGLIIKGIVFGEAKLEDILPRWVMKIWEGFKNLIGIIGEVIANLADKIIPWVVEQFGKISDWFEEHEDDITGAIANIADFFENTLGPAVTTLWTNVLEPFFSDIIDGALEVAGALIELFGQRDDPFAEMRRRKGELLPLPEKVTFRTVIEAIDKVLKEFFEVTFPKLFRDFRDFVLEFFELPNWEAVVTSWEGVWSLMELIVQGAVDRIKFIIEGVKQTLLDVVGDIQLLLRSLSGDPGAILDILGGELGLGQFVPPSGPGTPATQAHPIPSVNSSTSTQNLNLTINTSAPAEPIIADFRMMKALGGRI